MARQVVRCRFRVCPERVPDFWNAGDGSVKPCLAYEHKDGFTWITLDLAPASSVFVVFAADPAREAVVDIVQPAGSTLDLLDVNATRLTAHAWHAGTYEFKTSTGRTGKRNIPTVPADQLIRGPWKVTFAKDRGAPESVTMETLFSWSLHNYLVMSRHKCRF